MLDRLINLDRRWIYLTIALSVLLPILFPLGLAIRPSPSVISGFQAVEALPKGSQVLISFDYGPGTKVECHPMAIAMLHQCFRRDIRVVAMALDPAGQALAGQALRQVAQRYKKVDGVEETGFVAGLSNGWDAFQGATTGLLTAVGALLPFAILAALVGVPLRTWLRRRQSPAPVGAADVQAAGA